MADPRLYRAIAPIRTRKAVKPRPSGIAEVGDRLLLTDDEARVMAEQIALDESAPTSVPDSETTNDGAPTELAPTPVLDSAPQAELLPNESAPTSDPETTDLTPDELERDQLQALDTHPLTREEREAELLTIYQPDGPEGRKDWAAIKAIAIERGITDKPEKGWDDAILLILEKEGY